MRLSPVVKGAKHNVMDMTKERKLLSKRELVSQNSLCDAEGV